MELVDMLDLGSSAARRGGSTPFIRTKKPSTKVGGFFYFIQGSNRQLPQRRPLAKNIHRMFFKRSVPFKDC